MSKLMEVINAVLEAIVNLSSLLLSNLKRYIMKIPLNQGLYYVFSLIVFLLTYLLANGYFFGDNEILFTIPSFFQPVEVKQNMLIWIVLVYFVVKSYQQIEPNEGGSLVFLGKALYNLESGPHIVWKYVAMVVFGLRTRQQREFPAESEKIFYGDVKDMPEDMVEPFRITTGGKAKLEEGDDPLKCRLTLNVSYFTAFRISDMTQFCKVIGFGPVEENGKSREVVDLEEAFRQLEDTAKRVLNQEFARRTPEEIIAEQGKIATTLSRQLDKLVRKPNKSQEEWGIDLQEVALTNIGLSHSLNKALTDIPMALYEAQKAITAGAAAAKVYFLTAQQETIVKKLMLTAEAEGLEAIARKLKITDKSALSALVNAKFTETALGKVGENGKLVIVGGSGGVQNLLGLLEANKVGV